MAGHTPGPWVVDGEWVATISDDANICEVSSVDDDAEQDANAHLISAAPDYHAAAELVFAQDLTGETVLIDKAAWDALMAAHQKATGR